MKSKNHVKKAEHRGLSHKRESEGVEPQSWGQGKPSNMPQEVVMKEYPRNDYGDSVRFRDDMHRLTDDAKDNKRIFRSNVKRGMY